MRFLASMIITATLASFSAQSAFAEPPFPTRKFIYRADGKLLVDVLQDFAAAQSIPIVIDAGVEGTVNAEFNSKPADFLGALSKTYGLIWYFDGVTLFVYPSRLMSSRVFRMRGFDRTQVRDMLASLGMGDSRFPLRFNEAEQTLLAYGPPRHIELVQTIIDTLDGGARDQVNKTVQVFPLKYAVAADRISGQTKMLGLASILNSIFNGGARPAVSPTEASRTLGSVVGSAEKRRSAELTFGLKAPEADQLSARKDGVRDAAGRLAAAETGNVTEERERPFFQAEEASNSIIVRGTPERMKQYEQLIQQLDLPQDLVEIEATIIDVSTDEFESLGIEWEYERAGRGRIGVSPGAPVSGSTPGNALGSSNITTLVADAGRSLLTRIRALEGTGKARIVARPKVLGSVNRTASMVDKRVASVRVAGNLDVNLFTVEAGTTLEVTPQVIVTGDARDVRLTLFIEDGSFESSVVDSVPVVKRTEIRTEATIREGQSLLIGGISVETEMNGRTGLPILSRIPALGALFRNDEASKRRSERLFLLTPKVIATSMRSGGVVPPGVQLPPLPAPLPGTPSGAVTPPAAAASTAAAASGAGGDVDCPARVLGLSDTNCNTPSRVSR